MSEFARTLWRAAAMRGRSGLPRARLPDWLRAPGRASAMGAAGVLAAAVLATAALFAATGLPSAAWPLWSLLALPQGRIVPPADNGNFGWIERAIAQCEQEAARNRDTLYFLVIPVVPSDGDPKPWLAKSNGLVGSSVLLLGSQDTLDGLRAGSLRLDQRAYRFSILDPSATRAYPWRPALGVHKFAIRDASALASFKPGFNFRPTGDIRWADGEIPREAGTCYWTGALMPG